MAVQNVGPYSLNLLTDQELKESLGHAIDPVIRALRGEKIMRGFIPGTKAPSATFTLAAQPPQAPFGPQSGYMWRVHFLVVASNVVGDPARYTIYNGSDVSDLGQIHLHNTQLSTPAVTQPVPPAITVGASPFTFVNVQPYGVLVTVTGGTVTSITVNGQATGATSGTFFLAPNSFITVTYTAAPTMTEVNATANTPASQGQLVNIAYIPGTKGWWLFNDEQAYMQITGATVGNIYSATIVAAQTPQEMQGKLI